jgi:hypothetical protein
MPGMLLAISFWEPEATKSECCFEESDFEISLFPMQCYGNFEKSKKIIQIAVLSEMIQKQHI